MFISEVNLFLGDCLEYMKDARKESIDMVITSPPYNVGIVYGDNTRENDRLDFNDYHQWAMSIMSSLYPLIKPGGRICWEIGGDGRNMPLSYCWTDAALKVGFGYFSQLGLQHRKTNFCAWGSWMKADNVFTIPNFHQILVFYKNTPTKTGGITTITKDEFVEWTRGYWNINYSNGKIKGHPATFPIEIPARCMKLFGHEMDTVFDPFMGTGTTAIACIDNNRSFIGCEIYSGYYEMADSRIKEKQMQTRMDI